MGIEALLDDSTFKEPIKETDTEESTLASEDTSSPEEDSSQEDKVGSDDPQNQTGIELNDELVLKYIRENKQKEVNSFDDLFKEPSVVEKEVVTNVNPHEKLYDDYDRNYYKFKEETGLGRKEFDFVQQDFSAKSPLELSQEQVRRNTDVQLSTEQINAYLEKKLQVDLSDEEIDPSDLIELSAYSKSLKSELIGQQEKYKTTAAPEPTSDQKPEMVTLESGEEMRKDKYEELTEQRNSYIVSLKEDVSSATSFDVDIYFDDNGEKQTTKFNYDYSEDDRHSMISDSSDVNAFIRKEFRTKKGFDFKGLATFIDKAKNFDKYIALAWEQSSAQALERKISNDNNEQFSRVPKSQNQNKKSTASSILDLVPNS